MTEQTPAQELREAAKRIRNDASWPSETLMLDLGDHLDVLAGMAAGLDLRLGLPPWCLTALAVARAYMGTKEASDD